MVGRDGHVPVRPISVRLMAPLGGRLVCHASCLETTLFVSNRDACKDPLPFPDTKCDLTCQTWRKPSLGGVCLPRLCAVERRDYL